MLKVKGYFVELKDNGIISIYADKYELYEEEDGKYKAYNFMINNNIISIVQKDLVKKIGVIENSLNFYY